MQTPTVSNYRDVNKGLEGKIACNCLLKRAIAMLAGSKYKGFEILHLQPPYAGLTNPKKY